MYKRYVAVDCRLSEKCSKYLENNGYNIIKIPCVKCLDKPINAHPDMSLFKLKDDLFVSNDVEHVFANWKCKTVIGRGVLEGDVLKYPDDVGFNCALVGNKLICNKDYIHKQILKVSSEIGIEVLNVKQGYTKCSVCVVSDNAIVTEDKGIASECKKAGIDVLLLKTHSVKLDGYDYGFIGGCSGTMSDGKILFAGSVENHSEYKFIREFCEIYGKTPVSMSDEPLYDVGSIIEL